MLERCAVALDEHPAHDLEHPVLGLLQEQRPGDGVGIRLSLSRHAPTIRGAVPDRKPAPSQGDSRSRVASR
jgi:hypothetical protein